jgi:hypothetical protein
MLHFSFFNLHKSHIPNMFSQLDFILFPIFGIGPCYLWSWSPRISSKKGVLLSSKHFTA